MGEERMGLTRGRSRRPSTEWLLLLAVVAVGCFNAPRPSSGALLQEQSTRSSVRLNHPLLECLSLLRVHKKDVQTTTFLGNGSFGRVVKATLASDERQTSVGDVRGPLVLKSVRLRKESVYDDPAKHYPLELARHFVAQYGPLRESSNQNGDPLLLPDRTGVVSLLRFFMTRLDEKDEESEEAARVAEPRSTQQDVQDEYTYKAVKAPALPTAPPEPETMQQEEEDFDPGTLGLLMEECQRGDLQSLLSGLAPSSFQGTRVPVTGNPSDLFAAKLGSGNHLRAVLRVLRMLLGVLLGLNLAKPVPIVHNDIKAENTFLKDAANEHVALDMLMNSQAPELLIPKLGDFGASFYATLMSQEHCVTQAYFSSPEILARQPLDGERTVTLFATMDPNSRKFGSWTKKDTQVHNLEGLYSASEDDQPKYKRAGPHEVKHLVVAPVNVRNKKLAQIHREHANAMDMWRVGLLMDQLMLKSPETMFEGVAKNELPLWKFCPWKLLEAHREEPAEATTQEWREFLMQRHAGVEKEWAHEYGASVTHLLLNLVHSMLECHPWARPSPEKALHTLKEIYALLAGGDGELLSAQSHDKASKKHEPRSPVEWAEKDAASVTDPSFQSAVLSPKICPHVRG